MTQEREQIVETVEVKRPCPDCEGLGFVEHPYLSNYAGSHAEAPADPVYVDCEECGGLQFVWVEISASEYVPSDGAIYQALGGNAQ